MFLMIVTLGKIELARIRRDTRRDLERIRDNWIADSKKAGETVPTFAIGEYE